MKLALRIGIGVVIVVIVLIAIGVVYIDSIAKTAVERGASGAMGVRTTLTGADVGVMRGTFDMSGLRVENPPGFGERPFLTLDDGGVAVALGSLRRDTIELPHLRLSGLHVEIDKRREGANYNVILDNVKGDRTGEAPQRDSKPGKSYIVREVTIRDISVRVSFAPLGGEPTVITIPIELIELRDVGADQPMPLSQVAGVIVQAVFATVVEEGGSLLPTDLASDLTGALAQLGDLKSLGVELSTELGEKAEELIKGLGEEAGKAADEARKAIEDVGKNLFGGDRNN